MIVDMGLFLNVELIDCMVKVLFCLCVVGDDFDWGCEEFRKVCERGVRVTCFVLSILVELYVVCGDIDGVLDVI